MRSPTKSASTTEDISTKFDQLHLGQEHHREGAARARRLPGARRRVHRVAPGVAHGRRRDRRDVARRAAERRCVLAARVRGDARDRRRVPHHPGFSLYDTIVVFDKVQENQQRYSAARMPYGDVINVSMNQVLMRSINTSLAAVLPVLSLLVLGSGILGAVTFREFALALLVGLITGSYSSIFVASPLVAMAKEREPEFQSLRRQHATGAELERLVLGGTPAGRRERRAVASAAATAAPSPTAAPPPRRCSRTRLDPGRRSAASDSGSTL